MTHQLYQPPPQRLATAATQAAVRSLGDVRLHDADGTIEDGSSLYSLSDGFYGAPTLAHALMFKAPGECQTLAILLTTGDLRGARFVPRRGWCDASARAKKDWAVSSPVPQKRRTRSLLAACFARHEYVSWVDVVETPYPFLALDPNGTVDVNGKPLQPGDAPIILHQGYVVTRPNAQLVQLSDKEGVCERYRFAHGKLQRLVTRSRAAWPELASVVSGSASGEIVFAAEGVPLMIIPAGDPFTMHLAGGRTLRRLRRDGEIHAVSRTAANLEEFVIDGQRLWRQSAPRDWWSHEFLGVPGGTEEKPVLFKEVTPGITVYANGKVEALNRVYLLGEPIDLHCGSVHIFRVAGAWESMYVAAAGQRVGYLYAACGDWLKLLPVSPEQQPFTWRRCLGQQNIIDAWVVNADLLVGETPGLRGAGMALAAVCRLVRAAEREPCLAPLGFLFFALAVFFHLGRAALLVTAAPINSLWKIFRRVRRAIQLTQ